MFETMTANRSSTGVTFAGTFLIGVAFGLPFFLYVRERALESAPPASRMRIRLAIGDPSLDIDG